MMHDHWDPETEMVYLLPSELVIPEDWNCRQTAVSKGKAEELTDAYTDEQLEQSISERGIIQPPMVRKVALDGADRWVLVAGFRRVRASAKVRPNEAIGCVIMRAVPGEDAGATARICNLAENVHRQNLKPWEVADALHKLKEETEWTNRQIAERTGISHVMVSRLLAIRNRAHPSLWLQFKRWGSSLKISGRELYELTKLPKDDQPKAWKAAIERRSTGKRGKAKRPGMPKLRRYLHMVNLMAHKPRAWRQGAAHAFKVALGVEEFKTD